MEWNIAKISKSKSSIERNEEIRYLLKIDRDEREIRILPLSRDTEKSLRITRVWMIKIHRDIFPIYFKFEFQKFLNISLNDSRISE